MQDVEAVRKITVLPEVPYVQKKHEKDDHRSKRKRLKEWQWKRHIGNKNQSGGWQKLSDAALKQGQEVIEGGTSHELGKLLG